MARRRRTSSRRVRRVRRNRRGRGSRARRSFRRSSSTRSLSIIKRARPIRMTVGRIAPFPDRLRTTMRYSTGLTNVNSGTNVYFCLRGNGMFDPDTAIGGHQPPYYDNLMAIYGAYVVWRSRLKIRLTSNGVSALSTNGRVIVIAQPGSASLSSVGYNLEEQPGAQLSMFNSIYQGTHVRNYSCDSKTVLRDFSMTNLDCYGTLGVDPINPWYWGIYIESVDDSSSLSFIFEAFLEWDCEFFEKNYVPIN